MINVTAIDWPTVPLGTLLTDIQPGFASGKHNSIGEGVPHFRPMNVSTDGRIERTVLKYVDPASGRADLRLRRGDVVFNNTNSPELVGKTALFEDNDAPAFSNHMTRLRTDRAQLDPGYLALRLHQAWREGWFAEHCNNHVSQASIGRDVLRQFEIELPPLELQYAIRALYRRADASRASSSAHLATARRAIERFRQAVLVAACSGQLTAGWREDNPRGADRKSHQSIDDGRLGADPHETWPAVPASWMWASIEALLRDKRSLSYGILKPGKLDPQGVPMVRVMDISAGRIQVDQIVRVSPELAREYSRTRLQPGDVVLAVMATVGRSAVVPPELEGANVNRAVAVLKLSPRIDPDFMNIAISSPFFQGVFANEKLGSAQARINLGDLRSFAVPLPPIEEQREIVRRVSSMFELADGLLTRLGMASRQVDRSSQAILAKAFRGDLLALQTSPPFNYMGT